MKGKKDKYAKREVAGWLEPETTYQKRRGFICKSMARAIRIQVSFVATSLRICELVGYIKASHCGRYEMGDLSD